MTRPVIRFLIILVTLFIAESLLVIAALSIWTVLVILAMLMARISWGGTILSVVLLLVWTALVTAWVSGRLAWRVIVSRIVALSIWTVSVVLALLMASISWDGTVLFVVLLWVAMALVTAWVGGRLAWRVIGSRSTAARLAVGLTIILVTFTTFYVSAMVIFLFGDPGT